MFKLILSLSVASAVLSGCSESSQNDESATLAAPSQYGHCDQIIARGIYDTENTVSDYSIRKYEADMTCKSIDQDESLFRSNVLSECQAASNYVDTAASYDSFYQYLKNRSTSAQADAGVSWFFEAGGGLGGTSSSSTSEVDSQGIWQRSVTKNKYQWCLDQSSISSRVSSYRSTYCGDKQQDFSQNVYLHRFIQQVNQDVVQAWLTCVSNQRKGFTMVGRDTGNHVDVIVGYDKPEFAPQLLDLTWQIDNLEPLGGGPLPTKQPEGKQIISMKRSNRDAAAKITVNALANDYSSSATYELPPRQENLKCVEFDLVGVETGEIYELDSGHCHKTINLSFGSIDVQAGLCTSNFLANAGIPNVTLTTGKSQTFEGIYRPSLYGNLPNHKSKVTVEWTCGDQPHGFIHAVVTKKVNGQTTTVVNRRDDF